MVFGAGTGPTSARNRAGHRQPFANESWLCLYRLCCLPLSLRVLPRRFLGIPLMRGGLARRMCSDTKNSSFPPSVVVVVIGKKLLPQTLQKTVPSFSSGPSTLCPLPGQRTILGFVTDNRHPSNRTKCDWGKDSGDEGRLKEMATTLSRQVVRSPIQAGGHDPGDQFKPR